MNDLKIAVSSMTNADAFLREGVGPAMERLSHLGISCRFDGTAENPVPDFLWQGKPLKIWHAEREFDRLVELCRRFGCKYLRFAGFPGMAETGISQRPRRTGKYQLEKSISFRSSCGRTIPDY